MGVTDVAGVGCYIESATSLKKLPEYETKKTDDQSGVRNSVQLLGVLREERFNIILSIDDQALQWGDSDALTVEVHFDTGDTVWHELILSQSEIKQARLLNRASSRTYYRLSTLITKCDRMDAFRKCHFSFRRLEGILDSFHVNFLKV
ncbi:MAG: hypothetical protein Q9227_002974 [Pyrenula ochraceoflavens]